MVFRYFADSSYYVQCCRTSPINWRLMGWLANISFPLQLVPLHAPFHPWPLSLWASALLINPSSSVNLISLFSSEHLSPNLPPSFFSSIPPPCEP